MFVYFTVCFVQCSAGPTTLLESELGWWFYAPNTLETRKITWETEEFFAGCFLNRVYTILPIYVREHDRIKVTGRTKGELTYRVFSCDARKHFRICSFLEALEGKRSLVQVDFTPVNCDWLKAPRNVAYYREKIEFEYTDRYGSVDTEETTRTRASSRQRRLKYAVRVGI